MPGGKARGGGESEEWGVPWVLTETVGSPRLGWRTADRHRRREGRSTRAARGEVRSSLEGGCLVRRGRPDGDGGERRREWWWWLRVRETERQGERESEIQRGRDDESWKDWMRDRRPLRG
jgi:hypothetical protein